jgi:D-beta-D-heptose 7-phosphate kinase/D-beta-D-heptose 1-phosphate adenosyltransferase
MTSFNGSPPRLRSLLSRLAGKKVLVVGDIILDEYLFGRVRRISPEAPIPIFELSGESITPGAAAYVAGLIRHLDGEVRLAGLTGDDENGRRLKALLAERGIPTGGLIADPSRPTSLKTRVIAQRQQMMRLDREQVRPASPELTARLLDHVRRTASGVDAILCSDYDKGVFTPALIRGVMEAGRRARIPVTVNPKPRLALAFRGADLASMNQSEASSCLKRPLPDTASLERGGRELLRRLAGRAALVTRGEHGMALFEKGRARCVPTMAREVFDVTGAGDTVIATATLALAAGASPGDAVLLANVAAGLEVAKLGCAYVSRAEIRRAL